MPYKLHDNSTEIDPNDYVFGERFHLALFDYLERDAFKEFRSDARWKFNDEHQGLYWHGRGSEQAQLSFRPTFDTYGDNEGRVSTDQPHTAYLTWWDNDLFSKQTTEVDLPYRDLLQVIALAERDFSDEPNTSQSVTTVDLDGPTIQSNQNLLIRASVNLEKAVHTFQPGPPNKSDVRNIDKAATYLSLVAEGMDKTAHSDDPKTPAGALLKANQMLADLTSRYDFGIVQITDDDAAVLQDVRQLVEFARQRPSSFMKKAPVLSTGKQYDSGMSPA
ncbi:hypothetical protein [Phaeobacter piscinae]|uniref:hypothetical protein n=1 Tax=Phaeobacter piscinae TaxID=1580596 RepID=UPI00058F4FA4|nr:hypothetical protein [Phaeobacter piscinae]UTS82830.1 hypothetical protein OL67_003940 [Phaeobacter piscinae]